MSKKSFASDNYSGVHPEIMKALADVNVGHATAYGDDDYTQKAQLEFKKVFGEQAETFFVFIGTAANTLAIKALTQPHHAVICAESAHINVDECGAPERFTGCKLYTVPTKDGKLRVEYIEKFVEEIGYQHHSQPKVVSISQATEWGTVYTCNEIKELADFAHKHNMYLHVDGARIANAACSLGVSFKQMITNTGVDVLSFGGTKNGMMYGEAVVFLKPTLACDFRYIRKQGMQLASKMRYVSCQFSTYLEKELWKKNAEHANRMAKLLTIELSKIAAVSVTQKTEVNGVFVKIPPTIIPKLQDKYPFYVWDKTTSEVRLMCSWDTTEEDVTDFIKLLCDFV